MLRRIISRKRDSESDGAHYRDGAAQSCGQALYSIIQFLDEHLGEAGGCFAEELESGYDGAL